MGALLTQGMGTASAAAGQSLNLATMATGTNVLGNLFSGIGGYQQANYAASVAQQNARSALQAGQTSEEESKLKYGGLEAQQKADQGASGVSVNSGSALAVRQSTAQIGAMDAALLHYNAAREAYGQNTQAGLDQSAARGALFKGLYGASASILSGASNVSDKWLSYQMSGALAKNAPASPMTIPTYASGDDGQ